MTRSTIGTLALALGLAMSGLPGHLKEACAGGSFFTNRAVGGVAIDAQGVVEAPTEEDQADLVKLREETAVHVPAALDEFTELRAVSLKQLEATIARCRAEGKPLPEEVDFLAGLQRIRYVFVYPERHDVVIAGPAEGWKIDSLGNVVGRTTNRPVLLLNDLIVALRSGSASRLEPITCSIDPTPEGLQRLQQITSRMTRMGDVDQTLAAIEAALGPQVISVTGVPASSHFARTMVAADFRMKRLAMNFEEAPVDGLPSFLSMVSARGRSANNMMPRWWLAPNYEPLARTADGLAWELRGPGVKCMTEQQYLNAAGQAERGRPNAAATNWAERLTDKYSELADHDSAFGHLRNAMDLAVVGALIEKEQLAARAGFDAPWLMSTEELDRYPAPSRTSSKASVVRQRGGWVISASGGVEIVPWQIADKMETVDAVGAARAEMASDVQEFWWE